MPEGLNNRFIGNIFRVASWGDKNAERVIDSLFEHNIFDGVAFSFVRCLMRNNIFFQASPPVENYPITGLGTSAVGNVVVMNSNVSRTYSLPDGNTLVPYSERTSVVIGSSNGTFDGRWRLAPESPARGAGIDGADAGIFAGMHPYVLSGLPAVPFITEFALPAVVTQGSGLPIKLRAISVR